MNRDQIPSAGELVQALGDSCTWWKELQDYTLLRYPSGIQEWKYPGKKYGWNFRIRDKKRVIIYLGPRNGYFMVAFVFGQQSTDRVLQSTVRESIKEQLRQAKVYVEGRGIRIDVKDNSMLEDIKRIIDIKLAN